MAFLGKGQHFHSQVGFLTPAESETQKNDNDPQSKCAHLGLDGPTGSKNSQHLVITVGQALFLMFYVSLI